MTKKELDKLAKKYVAEVWRGGNREADKLTTHSKKDFIAGFLAARDMAAKIAEDNCICRDMVSEKIKQLGEGEDGE